MIRITPRCTIRKKTTAIVSLLLWRWIASSKLSCTWSTAPYTAKSIHRIILTKARHFVTTRRKELGMEFLSRIRFSSYLAAASLFACYTLFCATAVPAAEPDRGSQRSVEIGTARARGYGGYGDSNPPAPGRVRGDQWVLLAHELCCHAVPGTPHPTSTAYTPADPVIQCENEIRQEHSKVPGNRFGTRTN